MPQWLSNVFPLPGAPYPATVRPSLAAAIRKSSRSLLIFKTSSAKPACPARLCRPAASLRQGAPDRSEGSPALPLRTGIDAQRTSVRGDLFDVDNAQPGCVQRPGRGQEGEVRIVLVIDGVELTPLHEAQKVGELQGDRSRILHQGPQTCHEVPDVGYMRKHVVRDTRSARPWSSAISFLSLRRGTARPSGCPATAPSRPRSWPARYPEQVCPAP